MKELKASEPLMRALDAIAQMPDTPASPQPPSRVQSILADLEALAEEWEAKVDMLSKLPSDIAFGEEKATAECAQSLRALIQKHAK